MDDEIKVGDWVEPWAGPDGDGVRRFYDSTVRWPLRVARVDLDGRLTLDTMDGARWRPFRFRRVAPPRVEDEPRARGEVRQDGLLYVDRDDAVQANIDSLRKMSRPGNFPRPSDDPPATEVPKEETPEDRPIEVGDWVEPVDGPLGFVPREHGPWPRQVKSVGKIDRYVYFADRGPHNGWYAYCFRRVAPPVVPVRETEATKPTGPACDPPSPAELASRELEAVELNTMRLRAERAEELLASARVQADHHIAVRLRVEAERDELARRVERLERRVDWLDAEDLSSFKVAERALDAVGKLRADLVASLRHVPPPCVHAFHDSLGLLADDLERRSKGDKGDKGDGES